MNEQEAIEQLSSYKQKTARLKVLSSYSVGSGITVSRLNEDDDLQELHRKLRKMPSYMYLSKREQKLETIAHAYLDRYPTGTKAQLKAIPKQGADQEDSRLLRELRGKIEKVIEARTGPRNSYDAVLDGLAEFQDLQIEIQHIDNAMAALASYKPEYDELLRLRYIDGVSVPGVCTRLAVVEKTYFRWRVKAIREYIQLSIQL